MNEALRGLNKADQETLDGSPSTVRDADGYIDIKFQAGPIAEHGVNGTSIENVLWLLVRRLEGFQAGPFACQENAEAVSSLRFAIEWLEARTSARVKAGVEGTNQPH